MGWLAYFLSNKTKQKKKQQQQQQQKSRKLSARNPLVK